MKRQERPPRLRRGKIYSLTSQAVVATALSTLFAQQGHWCNATCNMQHIAKTIKKENVVKLCNLMNTEDTENIWLWHDYDMIWAAYKVWQFITLRRENYSVWKAIIWRVPYAKLNLGSCRLVETLCAWVLHEAAAMMIMSSLMGWRSSVHILQQGSHIRLSG